MSSPTLADLEANPQDQRAFDQAAKAFARDGDRGSLEALFARIPDIAAGEGANHWSMRVMMQVARTATDADLQAWVYYRTGLLYADAFGEKQMAEMAFRKIETLPDEPDVRARLYDFYVDFYGAQNNWRKLEQTLSDPQYDVDTSPLAVQRKLALIAEEREQPEKAVSFWQGVRKEDPSDAEADARLHTLYTQLGRWNNLVDLLKDRYEHLDESDIDGRIATQLELVDLFSDRMNAPARVIQAWQAILEIDPGNARALDALVEVYTGQNRWQDLVKILNEKVDHASSADDQILYLDEIATIYAERFNNLNESVRTLDRILEIDPSNRDALSRAKDIYFQQHNYEAYVSVRERELEFIDDPSARHDERIALAQLASEKLRKPEVPIALWLEVLDYAPDHPTALAELETLYERERRWEELADVLERRVGLTGDVVEAVALLDKLGTVVSSRLDDQDRAVDVWKRVLSFDGEHRKAQTELRKKFLAERDWDELEWFFRNYGDLGEWVRTIEGQLKHLEDEEEKTRLLFQIAGVYRDELEDTRRAVKSLEAVLDIHPRHAEAAQQLIPIYKALGSWNNLPDVYEIVLDATGETHARKQLLLELAEVQEGNLRNTEAAFFAYVQAVSENPEDTALHPQLKALAEASANWESYVVVLQDGVDHIALDDAKVAVLLEVGDVYRNRLGADDISLTFFNRVLAYDPHNPVALDAAEAAYDSTGQVDQLIVCYHRRLGMMQSAAERLETLYKLARAWREKIGANDEAEAILRDILDEYPDERDAYESLVEILMEEERFADLRELLLRKRELLGRLGLAGDPLADIECHLGMLTYATLEKDQVEEALEHYEAALTHDPHHPATVLRLEELLADAEHRLRISRSLAPVYERGQRWDKLTQMLEIQYLAAAEDEDSYAQVGLLERLTELYSVQTPDADLAWRTWGRLYALQPDSAPVRAAFEELTAELDRWADLVAIYPAFAEEASATDSRVAIKLTVARAFRDALQDAASSRTFFDQVLDEDPAHTEALAALEPLLAQLEDHEALLQVFETQRALAADVDGQIAYLFQASDLLRDRLERFEDAIRPAEDALALRPAHPDAVARLDELMTLTERWEDLAAVIEQTLVLVPDDTERVIALRLRLAAIFERHLGRVEDAIGLHASVFELDADNPAAVEALERLFRDDDYAPLVAPVLEPFYERHEAWDKLVETCTVRESHELDPAVKVDWNYRMAELFERRLDSAEQAFQAYQAAALLDPGSELTLSELLRLADLLEAHGELILFLQGVVEDIASHERRIETHRTISELARDRTGDLDGAEAQLRAILDLAPTDMAAVDALIALYRDTSNHASLVEMLLRKAPMVGSDIALRNELYGEAGDLAAAALEDPPQAIEIFETLHGLDPDGARALDALEALYAQTEDWDNLVRIYRLKIERAPDFETRKALAALMAEVQHRKLESAVDAVQTWTTVLEWDHTDRDALAELDRLYAEEEDWYNLREVLLKIQALVEGAEWDEAQFRIARLFEDPDRLGDVAQAIACYGALLDHNPEHSGAITSLEALVATSESFQAAFDVLRPVLEVQDRFEDLWGHYQVLAGHLQEEPERFVQVMHALATLAEDKLGDNGRALESLSRAFAVNPRDERTVTELERLASSYDFWAELVTIYQQQADSLDDEYLALSLRLRAGAILMEEIGDLQRATETYEVVREGHPDHAEGLERLHVLFERQERWEELAQTIRQQAELANDLGTRTGLLHKFAGICETQIGDIERAYEAYLEMLDLDRTSEVAVGALRRLFEAEVHPFDIAERLEPLYRESSRWDELDSLLRIKLELLSEQGDRLQLMRDLALLALDQRQVEGEAFEWYGQAMQLDPEDEGIYHEVNRLAEATGEFGGLQQYLLDAAEVAEDAERKVTLWSRAALVARDRLEDAQGAERIWRLVVGLDDKHAVAWRALDDLLVADARWDDLEEVLLALTSADDVFDDELQKVWTRLGELYRDRLSRPEDSVAAWRQVLELRDTDPTALGALQVLYHEAEAWPELFEILQRLADIEPEVEIRVGYFADMANIAETALDDAERAIELWEEVLMGRPGDVNAIRELQRLQQGGGNWQGLAEALERELQVGGADEARQLEVLIDLGRIWRDSLDDPFQSLSAWERARALAPESREILDSLHALHIDGGNDTARADVIESKLASGAYDADEQLQLWRELAELRTDVFGDQPKAIEAWRAVLEGSPGDGDAITNLEVLYENSGAWADLIALERVRLDLLGLGHTDAVLEARTESWLRIGTLYHDNLSDPASAAEAYRALLEEQPGQLEASRRLEAIYEQAADWEAVAELLLQRIEHLDTDDKLYTYQRLAGIHEGRLESVDNAFLIQQAALGLAPDDAQILVELERLAEASGKWQDLHASYESILGHLDEDTALDVMARSARVVRDRLGDEAGAVAYFERLLEAQSDNEGALRALAELNTNLERWPELVPVLTVLAEVTPDYAERKTLLRQIAELQEHALADLEAAVAAWEAVHEADEMDLDAMSNLERLHVARQAWDDLIGTYERRIGLEPQREVELRVIIADLLERYVLRVDEAVAAYEEVLNLDPGNDQALERLEMIYGEREDYDALLGVYERAFDGATQEEDRIRFASNIALISESKGDVAAAAESWQRVLDLSPMHEEAFQAIVRIHTEQEAWEDLVASYEQRYNVLSGAEARAGALMAMAEVYRARIDDPQSAIATYERVLFEQRGLTEALEALDALYESEGMWDQLIDNIDRILEVEADPQRRAEFLCRQGDFCVRELDDTFRATKSYNAALEDHAVPGYAHATTALLAIHRADERWPEVEAVLEHKLKHTRQNRERADIHVELAELLASHLNRQTDALAHFEQAEKANPDSKRALEALAEHYMRTSAWAPAMTRLEALIDRLDPNDDPVHLARTYKLHGLCAAQLYLDDQAIESLSKAQELAIPDLETLRALGRLHYKKGDFNAAEHYLQQVLDKHLDDLGSEDHVEVLMLLGESALKTGHVDRAQRYLTQVVEEHPSNVKALENIIEVLKIHNDWGNAVRFMEQLLGLKSDKLERFRLLMALGDAHQAKLADTDAAADCFRAALKLEVFPKEPAIKLVELSIQTSDFDGAIENLNRCLRHEDDEKRKAHFAFMAAVIQRDNLGNPLEAVKYFNVALDHDLERLSFFEDIERLLTREQQHKLLEQNYRRMIQRIRDTRAELPNKDAVLFKLYYGLGEIYRSRLKRPEDSIASFELARAKRPDDLRIREILASLYEGQTDSLDKAIAEHRWLIAQRPDRFDSYRRLVGLFKRANRPDAAWCTASLLVTLGQANDEEKAFYERYKPVSMTEPQRVIDHAVWGQAVASRMEEAELSRILEIVYVGLGRNLNARTDKDYGLKKKARLDLSDGLLVTNTIRNVIKMFAMQVPEIYAADEATGLEILQTNPPKLRIGADFRSGRDDLELAYHLAKRLTYFQPSHLIATLYPREALESLYLAAASLVDPDYQIPMRSDVDPAATQAILAQAADVRAVLEKGLTVELRQQLSAVMRSHWNRGGGPNLGRWHRALELTACHAGLVACGDPALVGQLIKAEPSGLSKLKGSDKLKDMVHYVLSEPYLALRRQLGVEIDYSSIG